MNINNDHTFLDHTDDKLCCDHCGKHITIIDWQVAPYCSDMCMADAEMIELEVGILQ